MASSMSGEENQYPARRVPEEKFPESHIVTPLLTKLVRSRWLDIGLVLSFASLWNSSPSWSVNT